MSVYNQSRNRVVQVIFIVVFLVIIGQLLHLQLISDEYEQDAINNARYRKVVYPDRGIIYDRKRKPILENTIMYDLMVTPGEIKGTDTAAFCRILGIDTSEFKKRILAAIIKNTSYKPSIFEPVLTPELFARLNEDMYRFNGFVLQERPVRSYPHSVAANLLGYIGEVDTSFLKRHTGEGYEMGDFAGLSGLERVYEKVLMGQRGIKYFIRDNKSRIQGAFENGRFDSSAIAGRSLYTSLDVEMQELAEKLLKNKIGSVVAINVKTGGILTMASGPSFDPNLLTGALRRKNFGRLLLDTARPLLNRAIKGQYPPGSTFKPLGALVALDEHLITPDYGYNCGGAYISCGKPVKCEHSGGGHADNLRRALAASCNSYFSQVFRLAIDNPGMHNAQEGYLKWKEYMNSFGLGVKLGVDLPSEDGGNIPDTSRYNRDFLTSRWNSCNILTLGIGQDRMLATPLQLANMSCIIANKGYYFTPHLVDSIENETEKDEQLIKKYRVKHKVTNISDEVYEAVHLGMEDVTVYGTAAAIKVPGVNYCAKTGTAQNPHGANHSIFVCFAPKENPRIAVAVVVENAGYGSTWAGPIAGFMMEKYLNDTIAKDRLSEVERISNADLVPGAIKNWYKAKEAASIAKAAEVEETTAAAFEGSGEDKKPAVETETGKKEKEKDAAKKSEPAVATEDKKSKKNNRK
ncbi:penicillin-binding protein 2 [Filimonas lacunae]|uniref:Penicillin-binding protein 2 n=1 Tax=Filimonas lacunae TaxID=477680 RepID=A0A173MP54_9BACT|nr:penicillin-binding protein 2 [Filimonas lacunae]BAV09266.1 penicillin-binding protein 2 [Filimonas lacunae]SIS70094.1 penicillin-binding protein 2 [Filimonas lacunae]